MGFATICTKFELKLFSLFFNKLQGFTKNHCLICKNDFKIIIIQLLLCKKTNDMLEKIDKNSIVITPNRRLANHLQQRFAVTQCSKNLQAWHSLLVLPLDSWLQNLWQNHGNSHVLLTSNQELLLWQQSINKISGSEFATFAYLAKEAFMLLNSWELDTKIDDYSTFNEDALVFQKWQKEFTSYCQQHNFITHSQIIPKLIEIFNESPSTLAIPATINLIGFEQITPQLQTLLQCFKTHNISFQTLDINNLLSTQSSISFNTQDEEIYTAALWAKKLLAQSKQSKIACVLPNLTALRTKVQRIFSQVFNGTNAFNISVGEKLLDFPLIHFIFNLLELTYKVPLKTLNDFLLSPYFAITSNEFAEYSSLIAALRRQNKAEITWQELQNLSAVVDTNGRKVISEAKHINKIALFFKELENIQENILNKNTSPSNWAKVFCQKIQLLGNTLSSITMEEQALLNRFQELFVEFVTLQHIFPSLSQTKALNHLKTLAANSIFQLPSENCNINILGILEASGINFDYLWVMGMDDEHWPTAPNLNPFIPKELQKRHNLPHATANKELQFCTALTNRFTRSAKKIIFSFVKHSDDHQVNPSPLIATAEAITLSDLNIHDSISSNKISLENHVLESYSDEQAPEITSEESIKSGAKIFKLQSLCPFRAFAEIRLHAEELSNLEIGISKKDRGTIIHLALELFWKNVQSQRNLINFSSKQLTTIVTQCLDEALHSSLLKHALINFEKESLVNLLCGFLEHEKQREDFTVIEVEKKLTTKIGVIPLNLRIDRIDRLTNGNKLVIDYKTGKNTALIADFLGERPKSLQLPLYAVLNPEATSCAFAQINIAKINFNEITLERINRYLKLSQTQMNSWQELLDFWRGKLEQLAADFASGKSKVDPVENNICEQCALPILCRIHQKY